MTSAPRTFFPNAPRRRAAGARRDGRLRRRHGPAADDNEFHRQPDRQGIHPPGLDQFQADPGSQHLPELLARLQRRRFRPSRQGNQREDAGVPGCMEFPDVQAREGRQLRARLEGSLVGPPPAAGNGRFRCRVQGCAGSGINARAPSTARPTSAARRPTPARRACAVSKWRPTPGWRKAWPRRGIGSLLRGRLAIWTPNTCSTSRRSRVSARSTSRRTAQSRTRPNGR